MYGNNISAEQTINPGCKLSILLQFCSPNCFNLNCTKTKYFRLLHGLRTSLSELISLLLVHPAFFAERKKPRIDGYVH